MQKDVPLVVMPVNKQLVSLSNAQLFAIANCVATPIATVLAPLQHEVDIKQVIISTYQSVSGAGIEAMNELKAETLALLNGEGYTRQSFARQIGFNIIPQIDTMLNDGYTNEERKIMQEISKIVGAKLNISATSVRVPVMIGHSASVSIEFERKISVNEVKAILKKANSVMLFDDYMTPVEVVGMDDVCVGRIRHDPHHPAMIHLWICSDNLRRGAATDMVEVADELIKQLSKG
jgi:aspartate-semialdehyde dehydrogenase